MALGATNPGFIYKSPTISPLFSISISYFPRSSPPRFRSRHGRGRLRFSLPTSNLDSNFFGTFLKIFFCRKPGVALLRKRSKIWTSKRRTLSCQSAAAEEAATIYYVLYKSIKILPREPPERGRRDENEAFLFAVP